MTSTRFEVLRRRTPGAVGAALLLVRAALVVDGVVKARQRGVFPPQYADYLPPQGPSLVDGRLVAGALVLAVGAIVLGLLLGRRLDLGSRLPRAWRWTPWVAGAALVAAGVAGLLTSPRVPAGFGWFAYTPLSTGADTAVSADGPDWTMSWPASPAFDSTLRLSLDGARPLTGHLVAGALLLLAGLILWALVAPGFRRAGRAHS